MNLVTVTRELTSASVEELAQALRLIASRAMALQSAAPQIDTIMHPMLLHTQTAADALADTLYDLANTVKARELAARKSDNRRLSLADPKKA